MPYRADVEAARVHEDDAGAHADAKSAWEAVREHWIARRDALKRLLEEGRGRLRLHEHRTLRHRHEQAERAIEHAFLRQKKAGAL
jgi:hypothetical protein